MNHYQKNTKRFSALRSTQHSRFIAAFFGLWHIGPWRASVGYSGSLYAILRQLVRNAAVHGGEIQRRSIINEQWE